MLAVPGLLVALPVLRVRDYPTVRPERSASRPAAIALLRAGSAVGAITGAVLLLIVTSALYTWLPTDLQGAYHLGHADAPWSPRAYWSPAPRGRRAPRWPPTDSPAGTGACACASRPSPRWRRRASWAPAFGVVPPGGGQLALLLAGAAMMTCAVGPVAAIVIDVVHTAARATATSVLVVAQNLLGLTIGPVLTGFLADRIGLVPALALVPLLGLVAAGALWLGARSYPGDRVEGPARAVATASSTRAPR